MPGHKRTGRARVWCSDACRFRAAKARRRERAAFDPAWINGGLADWLAALDVPDLTG
jgi:hypothetical protein